MNARTDARPFLRCRLLIAVALLDATICGAACNGQFDVELRQSVASPDGSLVADYYLEYGGGGPGWQADFIRIPPSSEHFRTGTDHIFRAGDIDHLDVKWTDNNHLEVSWTPAGLPILKHEPKWKDVTITYVSPGMFR
jgi:hypothetical protein